MKLEAIKYCRFADEKSEWCIEGKPNSNEYGQWCTFSDINLIVGQNATGKTKALNVIKMIADLLAGDIELSELTYNSASYQLQFSNGLKTIQYDLSFKNAKVLYEKLSVEGQEFLTRKTNEISKLFYAKKGEYLEFQAPDEQIAALLRRDSIQHPFFEDLYKWGQSLRYYPFATPLGKNIVSRTTVTAKEDIDLKDSNYVMVILEKGKEEVDSFETIVKKDMTCIGYDIEEIGIDRLHHGINPRNSAPYGLYVKEKFIENIVTQDEISEGMFRALSLIIQLNYALLTKMPRCILIDDIGEGLDYERSKTLIELLIEKTKQSSVQLFMATNNRFVMNKVPLEYWSVIKKEPNKSIFYDNRNSREIFDDFAYTGLNNFDFFATDFFLHGFEEEVN